MSVVPLRVGLIGTGLIAQDLHIPGWKKLPDAQLVALADPASASLAAAAELAQVDRAVSDYRRLLDDPSIDAVDICVPSALHAEVTIAALQAGKHVLCEKPMATSARDAAAMLAAQQASGRQLMIGQHFRFDPGVQALRQYLELCPLGHVYYTRAQWLRRRRLPARPGFARKILSGGGPLYDIGVHMLDLAWWLLDCPRPVSVSGATFDHLVHRDDLGSEWGQWDPATIDVEDFAAGLIRFEGNRLLLLEASWLGFQPESEFWRLQLFGSHAGVTWPDCRASGEREHHPWDVQLAPAASDRPHHLVLRHFTRAILDGTPVPIPPWQSAGVVTMLEALYASSHAQCEAQVAELPRP